MSEREYLLYTYGNAKTAAEIEQEFPFSNKPLNEDEISFLFSGQYFATFDPHIAYKMKKQGENATIWGGKYEHVLVFVFLRKSSVKLVF